MNMDALMKRTVKTLSENSSVLLTGAAVAGTVTTAIFAGKGAYEHGVSEAVGGTPEDPKQRLKDSYKFYIPAAAAGVTTIGCIVGIHSVNTRKQAALISAYSVMDKTFADYREKVSEVVSAKDQETIKDEVAKKQVSDNPVVDNEIHITGAGDQLCYDSLTGRYFRADMETLRKAQNDVNAQIINDMYCSQNEFYSRVGLTPAQIGEELGWTTDRFMDISFSSTLTEDGRPCLVMNYIPGPIRNYWSLSR